MRILYTTPVYGNPPIGGPELRVANTIKTLSRESTLSIYVRSNSSEQESPAFPGTKIFFELQPNMRIKRILRTAYRIHLSRFFFQYGSKEAERIVSICKSEQCQIVWFGYGNVSLHVMKKLRKYAPELKIVCDTDSVWSRFLIRAFPHIDFLRGLRALIKGKLKETQERKMVDLSDVLTAVSEVDAQYYKKLENQKSDKVRVVSNAIDLTTKETNEISINYFKHPALTIIGSFGSKESAMDVGTKWFIDKVWDQVRTAVPEATLYLVGNGSDRNWESNKVRGIYVLGRVPSTAEILRLTDINLVPLLFESGTRFKILESGMYSTAVVSTTLGAEGLKIVDGRDILLADTPSEFRDAVLTLMDESLRKKLGANLNQKIIDSYTTDNLRKECLEVLETLEG